MEIRTPRLLLRPLRMEDLHTLHAYTGDPENARYMVFHPDANLEETRAFLREMVEEWKKPAPQKYELAILLNGEHIGGVSLYLLDGGKTGEIGWIIRRDHWRQGIALEAAQAMMDYFARALPLRRFIAQCDTANVASYRLMERLGMRRISCCGGRYNKGCAEERMEYTYEKMVE